MAKTRMVNTKFWNDAYVAELDPMEKLLFLYFLTNQHTDICGVYELSIRSMVFDTGIDQEKIRNIISRFTVDGKIEYIDGWVVVKNFLKHQQKASPKVAQGIVRSLKEIPESIRTRIQYDTVSHLDLDSNLNSNSNLNLDSKEGDKSPTPAWVERITNPDHPERGEYRELVKSLADKDYLSPKRIDHILTEEFIPYWLEKGENAKKARWEKEKAFDYQRRIRTWMKVYHEKKRDQFCGVKWHTKDERCYCVKDSSFFAAPKKDYDSLPPSGLTKDLAMAKRVVQASNEENV